MTATRYLKRRRLGWSLQIAIPRGLEPHFDGRRKIEVSLKTRDLSVAQRARGPLLERWKDTFERVQAGGPVSFPTNFTIGQDFSQFMAMLEPRATRPRLSRGLGGDSISEAAAAYVEELQRDKGARLTAQTVTQMEATFRLFSDFTRDAPLASIKRATAAAFLDEVARLDPHWGRTRGVKELSLAELTKSADGSTGLSNRTLNRYSSALSGLFKWARNREMVTENPFADLTRPKGKAGYVPFSIAELNKIFGDCLIDETLRWISLIGLFSGMRLGEICQLRTEDVKSHKDFWFFDVYEEVGRLKTEAARRRVPVHSELIRLGLLKIVQVDMDGLLFPDLKPGGPDNKLSWHISKDFTEHRRSVGVKRARVAFHSFRKNFTTALDQAGVAQADAAMLVGHARGFTFDVYSLGPGLERLRQIVEKVRYEGLKLRPSSIAAATL